MMAAATHDLKAAIIKTIERHGGEARQVDIARGLGPQWAAGSGYVRLRQIMRQMVKAHVLTTTRRGVYAVHPTFGLRGFDTHDLTVRQIEAFLISRGGSARTAEIHEAVGARDLRGGVRDAEHRRVTFVLKRSGKFRNVSPGIWALLQTQ